MNIEMKLLFTVSFQKTMVHITLLYYTECYAFTELKPYSFLGPKKKLVVLSKEKDCEVLEDWIRSITAITSTGCRQQHRRKKMRTSGGRSGLVCSDTYKIFMLAMVTTSINVNMESWTTTIDRRDGSGQVRTDHLLILMCINIIFLSYFL